MKVADILYKENVFLRNLVDSLMKQNERLILNHSHSALPFEVVQPTPQSDEKTRALEKHFSDILGNDNGDEELGHKE